MSSSDSSWLNSDEGEDLILNKLDETSLSSSEFNKERLKDNGDKRIPMRKEKRSGIDRALKQSKSRAVAATRIAGKMKVLVDAHSELKKKLQKRESLLEEREKAVLASKNDSITKIRELEYRNSHLAKELISNKTMYKKLLDKSKAQELHIVKSLEEVRKNDKFIITTAQSQLHKLQRNVKSLDRHLHSHSDVVCKQLLSALNLSISSLSSLLQSSAKNDNSSDASLLSKEHIYNSKHDEIMETLCDKLQQDNSILHLKIREFINTNNQLKERSEIAEALIPQYRLAVTKARSHSSALRQRLSEEAANVILLKKQIEKMENYYEQILHQEKNHHAVSSPSHGYLYGTRQHNDSPLISNQYVKDKRNEKPNNFRLSYNGKEILPDDDGHYNSTFNGYSDDEKKLNEELQEMNHEIAHLEAKLIKAQNK